MIKKYDFEKIVGQLSDYNTAQLDVRHPSELQQFLKESHLASLILDCNANNGSKELATFASAVREVASQWPSAGLALCMHAHIVYGLERYPNMIPCAQGALESVRENQSLMASAFADGVIGSQVFDTALTGDDFNAAEIQLQGAKLPCTMSDIASFYCISLKSQKDDSFSIALVEEDKAIQVDRSFWQVDLFRAASSQKVIFDNVTINQQQIAAVTCEEMPLAMNLALTCFNYLAISSYLGVIDKLREKITQRFTPQEGLLKCINRLKAFDLNCYSRLAELVHSADKHEEHLNLILHHRYQLEGLIRDFTLAMQDSLSGLTFITDPEFLHLFNTMQLLRFHPISEAKFLDMLSAEQ